MENGPFMVRDATKRVKMTDKAQALRLKMLFKEPYVQAAFGKIAQHLLSTGLRILPCDKKKRIDPLFEKLIPKRWNPFLRRALADLYVYGYVGVTENTRQDKRHKTKTKFPIVVERDDYDVRIITGTDHGPEYEVVNTHGGLAGVLSTPAETRISLYFWEGREPCPVSGLHQSVLSIMASCAWKNSLMETYYFQASQRRSNPPIVTEEIPEIASRLNLPEARMNWAEASFPSNKGQNIGTYGADSSELDQTSGNKRGSIEPVSLFNSSECDFDESTKRRRLDASQSVTHNVHKVDSGFRVSARQPDMPELQPDFCLLDELYKCKIFALFGVPVGLVFPTSASGSRGAGASAHIDNFDTQTFNQTLEHNREMLIDLTTETYLDIVTPGALELDVILRLEVLSSATASQVFNMMYQNMISRDFAMSCLFRIYAMPPWEMFHGKNHIDRPIVGGNEMSVDGMIEARIANIDAETEKLLAEAKATKEEGSADEGAGEAEMQLKDKELELKDKERECQKETTESKIKIMDKQMELMESKLDATIKGANAQIKVNKSTPAHAPPIQEKKVEKKKD